MPETVLAVLKVAFLALLYLFLARVVRAVWVEIFAERRSVAEDVPTGSNRPAPPSRGPSTKTEAVSRTAEASAVSTRTRRKDATADLVLRIVEPPERRGATFAIADETIVGRAAGCAVSLDDTFASQIHARVFRRDGVLFVEDMGSTNGTFLNRKAVHGPVPIHKSDRIQIGGTVLEVQK